MQREGPEVCFQEPRPPLRAQAEAGPVRQVPPAVWPGPVSEGGAPGTKCQLGRSPGHPRQHGRCHIPASRLDSHAIQWSSTRNTRKRALGLRIALKHEPADNDVKTGTAPAGQLGGSERRPDTHAEAVGSIPVRAHTGSSRCCINNWNNRSMLLSLHFTTIPESPSLGTPRNVRHCVSGQLSHFSLGLLSLSV